MKEYFFVRDGFSGFGGRPNEYPRIIEGRQEALSVATKDLPMFDSLKQMCGDFLESKRDWIEAYRWDNYTSDDGKYHRGLGHHVLVQKVIIG